MLTAFIPALPFTHSRGFRQPVVTPRRPRHASIRLCTNDPPLSLPNGSSSSESSEKKDLGFVGAEQLGISFVCDANACGTRIVKTIKRQSYERGTVVIQCPTCEKHHVIADNLGMYSQLTGGRRNIEEIAASQGQKVTRVDNSVFDLEKPLGEFFLFSLLCSSFNGPVA